MNKTTYRPTISPFIMEGRVHPIEEEVQKNLGTLNLTATFTKDTRTIEMFKNIPNLIAFTCVIKQGNQLISEGHGSATINRMNKFLERSILYAKNASFIDAVARSIKILDTLYLQSDIGIGEAYKPKDKIYEPKNNDDFATDKITDKQKQYLLKIIEVKVSDKKKRDQWKIDIERFSKEEASQAIQSFS